MSLNLQQINLGTPPYGKDGDTNHTANDKTNQNMTAIQAAVNSKLDSSGATFSGAAQFFYEAQGIGGTYALGTHFLSAGVEKMSIGALGSDSGAGNWQTVYVAAGAAGWDQTQSPAGVWADYSGTLRTKGTWTHAGSASFSARPTWAGNIPWDSVNLFDPATLSGAQTFTGQKGFLLRPTFNGQTPWDSANLPNPAQTTGAAFTGQVTMGAGLALTQANGGIEVGSQTATNTPFIDFHSSGSSVDYDARIIASGGNTATPGKGTLSVLASNVVLGAANLQMNGYSAAQWPIWMKNGATGSTSVIVFSNSAGSTVGSIGAGDSGTAYNTTSDYRLKQNYLPIVDALASVRRMRFYTGEYVVEPGRLVDYVIAHEQQEETPFAVSGTKDAMQTYPILRDGFNPYDVQPDDVLGVGEEIIPQSVDYSKLVPRLGAAIQELSANLDAALARIAQLEARPS
ncbi:hypothetical protein ACQ4P5_20195 [Ralstonia sp. L16]|uniref:hypothetical protein n=1 Tax=Ralstonia sp. L16 TaxID=3423950 RepID=UPI003F7A29F5